MPAPSSSTPRRGSSASCFAPDYEAPADVGGNNVYDVIVAVSDGYNAPVTQALSISVTDVTGETGAPVSHLFGPGSVPANVETGDPNDYELGTKFVADNSGLITELRYYRGAADAGDTDTRTLNLWDANGNHLGSVTVTSAPGETGWQVGTLDTPIAIAGGTTYVVSYGTVQNYAYTSNFFTSEWVGPDGVLSGIADGNGVVAGGGTGLFPTIAYASTNYWVDVTFETVVNGAPVFTSPASVSIAENTSVAATLTASDPDGNPLAFSIAGGADAGAFTIDSATGLLSFVFPPDYEAPADVGGNNVYDVVVAVSDGFNTPVTQALSINITDVASESGATISHLFGPTNLPANVETSDPTDYELGTKFVADHSGIITELRYYRGAADAGDTDTRDLNLWDANGNHLASVTVTSAPGETGWQIGTLDTPITISGGTTYVVSYGTVQNYAYTSNFFTSEWVGPDGVLSGVTGGNGVFAAGGTGLFPTIAYASTNYWVDVTFESGSAENHAPTFSGTGGPVLDREHHACRDHRRDRRGRRYPHLRHRRRKRRVPVRDRSAHRRLSFAAAPDFELPGDANGDNLYDLIVSVSDGIAPSVERAYAITVTNDPADPSPGTAILFASNTPAATSTSDPNSYELGTKFETTVDGAITALRYYRGAEDSGDTDTRTLNLWDSAGNKLGSVTVVSDPGESGWQTGTLATPIDITAGETYVVSYGTEQNYVYSSGFFASDWFSADETLFAPGGASSGGNGVFAFDPGDFPTASYNDTNYWADVVFDHVVFA